MLLSGCSGFSYTFSGWGNKTTIDVSNAEDGKFGESSVISAGSGSVAVVESALDKGQLQIDFAEATVFNFSDEPEEVVVGDVVKSVTVGPGSREELPLEAGDYVLQVTAIGTANGKVTATVETA